MTSTITKQRSEQLSYEAIAERAGHFSGSTFSFQPSTNPRPVIPVQCSNQLSYEATTGRAGHISGSHITIQATSVIKHVTAAILVQRSNQPSYGRVSSF